jgi:hypothetical protein
MVSNFERKAQSGGLSGLKLMQAHSNLDKIGSNGVVDQSIDANDASVDENLR